MDDNFEAPACRAGHEFREHAGGLLEQRAPQPAAGIPRPRHAPRIERDDAAGFRPLRERGGPDGGGRMGVGEVGAADRVERTRRYRKRAVKRVGTAMAADDVAVLRLRDRAALARGRRPPTDRKARLAARLRMGGEADMVETVAAKDAPTFNIVQRFRTTNHMLTDFRIVIPERPPGPAFGRPDGRLREAEVSSESITPASGYGFRALILGLRPMVSPRNENTYDSNHAYPVATRAHTSSYN
jgi:hypothetical protein